MPDSNRQLFGSLVFLAGLCLTAYMSFVSFELEKKAAEQRLIHQGSLISNALNRQMMQLEALLDYASTLDKNQLFQLKKLHPELSGIGSWTPATNRQTADQLDWAIKPLEYLWHLPDTPTSLARKSAEPHWVSPITEAIRDNGQQEDGLYWFDLSHQPTRVYAVRVTPLLDAVLEPFVDGNIHVALFDLQRFSQDPFYRNKLTQSSLNPAIAELGWLAKLSYQNTVSLQGNDWLLQVRPLEQFVDKANWLQPLLLFVGGVLLSLLIAILIAKRQAV